MLVKLGSSSPNRGENKKYLKPPPSFFSIIPWSCWSCFSNSLSHGIGPWNKTLKHFFPTLRIHLPLLWKHQTLLMTPSKQVSLTPWPTTQGFFLVLNIRHRNNKNLVGVGFLDQHKPTDWPLQRFTGCHFFYWIPWVRGKMWLPLVEYPWAICSLDLHPYALYNPYIVGTWWYKVTGPSPKGTHRPTIWLSYWEDLSEVDQSISSMTSPHETPGPIEQSSEPMVTSHYP